MWSAVLPCKGVASVGAHVLPQRFTSHCPHPTVTPPTHAHAHAHAHAQLEVRWWDAVCGIINDESEPECFQVLVDRGYDANEPNIYPANHPTGAMMDGMIGPLVEQFKKDGSLPPMGMAFMFGSAYNAPNVLFWCATAGNLECARIMCKAGADVAAKNSFDMTHVEVAERLGFVQYATYFKANPDGTGPVRPAKVVGGDPEGSAADGVTSDARYTHAGLATGETKTSTSDA